MPKGLIEEDLEKNHRNELCYLPYVFPTTEEFVLVFIRLEIFVLWILFLLFLYKFSRLLEQYSFPCQFNISCPVPSNVIYFMSHVMLRKKNEARSWVGKIFVIVPQLAIIINICKKNVNVRAGFSVKFLTMHQQLHHLFFQKYTNLQIILISDILWKSKWVCGFWKVVEKGKYSCWKCWLDQRD